MIDKNLLAMLGSDKKYILYCLAVMLLGLLANLTVTACICWAVYLLFNYSGQGGAAAFIKPAVAAAAAILLRYLTTVWAALKDIIGRNAKKQLRERLYDKILRLGAGSDSELSMAGLTQVALEGIEQLDLYYSSYIPQFAYAMLAPMILFAVTVGIEWRVAVVLICCVPLIPISIIAVSKYAKRIFAKYWGKYTSMGDMFLDSVQGLKELKIFRADEARHRKMNEAGEEFRKITMKVLVMQLASTTIMDLVAYGGAGAGIAMTLFSVTERGLSPVAALFLILVAVDFFLPLRAFGSAFHVAMNGVSAGKKIQSILEQPEPVWGSEEPENMEIELKDLSFSYDGKRKVLKDVDMRFPQRGLRAIVGESGCGKSTIVSLLLGVCRPEKGSVCIGGKALEEVSREAYYKHIAVVSNNSYVFNDTVRENFLMLDRSLKDEQIWAALEKVDLAEHIRDNGGLDKLLSEDAANISGGQKQRLALAVQLAADKDIYVFDEATSNVDVESESIIMKTIVALSKEKNVILISHRLENVLPADCIYYMEEGGPAESGTHEELMKLRGGYARLYSTQKALEGGLEEVQL